MKLFKTGNTSKPRKRITKGRQSKLGDRTGSKKKTGSRKGTSKRLPYVVKSSKRQVGTTNKPLDKKRKALAPGRRKAKSGREYTENRKNRSDLKGGV